MKMRWILSLAAILIIGLSFFISCRTVETGTLPVQVTLKILADKETDIQVFMFKGLPHEKKINPEKDALYVIDIPHMDGGYSECLFIKYNMHDPKTYKIIQIYKQEKLLQELSLEDLEKLNKDQDGYTELKIE